MSAQSNPTETLRLIDRRIDGVRMELFRRIRVNIFSCHSWQLAWDRNPDLLARQETLFRLRDLAQLARDAEIDREYRTAQRRQRAAYRKSSARIAEAA